MTMSSPDIDALSRQLMGAYNKQFVCTPATDVVIEGYPRSSNTFTVDYLYMLSQRRPQGPLRIAHHTHDARNIELGVALGRPVVVLLREPVDAISSYMIYSGADAVPAMEKYVAFYSAVRPLRGQVMIARFEDLTRDFNSFVDQLNDRFGFGVPLSETPDRDAEAAKDLERIRGEKMYQGDDYAARIAVPNEERRARAAGVKAEVAELLARRPHATNLHELLSNG